MSTNTKSTYACAQNTYAHIRIHTLTHMHIFFLFYSNFVVKITCRLATQTHTAIMHADAIRLGWARPAISGIRRNFYPNKYMCVCIILWCSKIFSVTVGRIFFSFFFSFRNFDKMQNVSWNVTEQCVEWGLFGCYCTSQ